MRNIVCYEIMNQALGRGIHVRQQLTIDGIDRKVPAIFLSFIRDFEAIDRDILLRKLSCYGVKDKELKWFSSHLLKRRINNKDK